MCAIHLRLQIDRHDGHSQHVSVIINESRLRGEVPAKPAVAPHDELEVSRQRTPSAQHLRILRGVRLGEFGGEEVGHRVPPDVPGPAPHSLGEAAVDVEIAAVDVLGGGHHLGEPLHEIDEGLQ